MSRPEYVDRADQIGVFLETAIDTGKIGTPGTSHEALRVKRAWVFGSTVKGSESPNDLDVLLEMHECGRIFWSKGSRKSKNRPFGAKTDKRFFRAHRMFRAVACRNEGLLWLKGSLKRLSLHDFALDGEIAIPRILIYPRNDLARVEPKGTSKTRVTQPSARRPSVPDASRPAPQVVVPEDVASAGAKIRSRRR